MHTLEFTVLTAGLQKAKNSTMFTARSINALFLNTCIFFSKEMHLLFMNPKTLDLDLI